LIVCWPFPEKLIRELAGKVKGFVVPEINYGQIVLEVERCAAGGATVLPVTHAGGGVHEPDGHPRGDREAANEHQPMTDHLREHPHRPVPADGPDSPHLVSDLRHRHGGQVLRQALEKEGWTSTRWPSSPASAAPAAWPAT
jgi:hypothetical protein